MYRINAFYSTLVCIDSISSQRHDGGRRTGQEYCITLACSSNHLVPLFFPSPERKSTPKLHLYPTDYQNIV